MSRRTGAQFTGMLAARISANALQAVNVIILARAVTPDLVGVASAVIGLGMVVFTVTDLGASTYVMKAYAEGDMVAARSGLRLINLSGWLSCVGATGLAFAVHGPLGLPIAMLPLVASVAVDRLVEYRLAVPIAATSTAVPAVSIILRRSVQFGGFLLMWRLDTGAVAAYSLSQLLGALVGYVHSVRFLPRYMDSTVPAAVPIRAIVVQSFPYLVNNVSVHIQLLDTFLVTTLAGAYRGGMYSAAMRVTSPLLLIPGTLAAAVLPAAARATPYEARSVARRLTLAVPLMVIMAAAGGSLLAEPVCVLLFGTEYAAAAAPLTLLLMTFPFALIAAALSAALQARGDQVRVARVGLIGAAGFILAVGVGAWLHGAIGAAAGGLVAVAAKCLPLTFWATRPKHRAHLWSRQRALDSFLTVGDPSSELPTTHSHPPPTLGGHRRMRRHRHGDRRTRRRRGALSLQVDGPDGGRNLRRGLG
ncbi:hypothetical protein BJF87_19645 [Gordonia sp. CNJ-863]|uniref:lipopolysaccharide biosynthesis protein n=1 Tax=Gordonia sp. CNJ-863 TaxID=1904963 RepID=UPI00095FC7B5|nr:hypothetical protein [Gordonia sp. CNJ-863]OLT48650.1 hypothetical protein BJF87_19645 [Gordonia sp. CNJ-863]